MVKATKKIIKKFTKAIHGHPQFTKILFENLTFFTQGNGITRLETIESRGHSSLTSAHYDNDHSALNTSQVMIGAVGSLDDAYGTLQLSLIHI